VAIKDNTGTVVRNQFHPNNALAQFIVNLWTDTTPGLRGRLLARGANGKPTPGAMAEATRVINATGSFNLQSAVVISEAEYTNDYILQQDETVFVLPNNPGPLPPPALLAAAKRLMRDTPNGI
jgi:hypothetical protein